MEQILTHIEKRAVEADKIRSQLFQLGEEIRNEPEAKEGMPVVLIAIQVIRRLRNGNQPHE